jgi:hypothetical protein
VFLIGLICRAPIRTRNRVGFWPAAGPLGGPLPVPAEMGTHMGTQGGDHVLHNQLLSLSFCSGSRVPHPAPHFSEVSCFAHSGGRRSKPDIDRTDEPKSPPGACRSGGMGARSKQKRGGSVSVVTFHENRLQRTPLKGVIIGNLLPRNDLYAAVPPGSVVVRGRPRHGQNRPWIASSPA